MRAEDIKRALNKRVVFKSPKVCPQGAEYILSGAIFRLGDNGYFYQAELTDLTTKNSVVICSLDEIEVIGGRK